MKMQMSENDLERVSIKKSPVYILFLFIVSAQAFLGIFYDLTWPVRGTNKNQSALVLTAMTSVGFYCFYPYKQRRANGMVSEWSYKSQNSSYGDIVQ